MRSCIRTSGRVLRARPSRVTYLPYRRAGRLIPCHPATSTTIGSRHLLTSSPRATSEDKFQPIPSDEWEAASAPQKIKWMLEPQGDDEKWGWVVYRTSYKPELDPAWETLKELIRQQSREDVARSEAPDLIEKMDWVFVEDAATLEGASRQDLRRRFQAFARPEMARFSLKEEDVHTGVGSRYLYFLQADEDALLSLLRHPVPIGREGGHVNLVKGWELVVAPPFRTPEYDACADDDDPYDAWNQDWMKMMVGVVAPEVYAELNNLESWYLYYMEPPGVCDH